MGWKCMSYILFCPWKMQVWHRRVPLRTNPSLILLNRFLSWQAESHFPFHVIKKRQSWKLICSIPQKFFSLLENRDRGAFGEMVRRCLYCHTGKLQIIQDSQLWYLKICLGKPVWPSFKPTTHKLRKLGWIVTTKQHSQSANIPHYTSSSLPIFSAPVIHYYTH